MRRISTSVSCLVVGATAVVLAPASPAQAELPSGWSEGTAQLVRAGSTVLASAGDPAASSVVDPAGGPLDVDRRGESLFHNTAKGPQAGLPSPAATAISYRPSGFDGISQLDQRLADGGNQPSIEVPDQALCVGNGYVVEGVNVALRVFSTTGAPLTGTVALGPFFGDGHEQSSADSSGVSHSDPACLFDPATGRFFVTTMRYKLDPSSGNVVGTPAVELAVSRTGDPRATWDVYSVDTTADGAHGSPAVAGCPCLGDQPKLGADANGIFVATSLWTLGPVRLAGEEFFALSKRELASATASKAVVFSLPRPEGMVGSFPVDAAPATVPPGGSYDATNGGTEYLTAACPGLDHLFVFALTNTRSLDSATPQLGLSEQLIDTEPDGAVGVFRQPDGDRPLASWIQQQTGGAEPPVEYVDSGVPCTQVVFADGRLWTAKTAEVKPPHGPVVDGIAWMQVIPTVVGGRLTATLANQGYVVIDRNNAILGAIAVDRTGHGVMTFDVYGPDYHPSAAYVPIDEHGTGPAQIVAQGQVPLDNFDGYSYFGASDRVARYGDYSAAVTTGDGDFWIANEYLPDIPRILTSDWDTHITEIHQ